MDININKVIFYILKTYNKDESICPVRTVVEYIIATEKIRKSENTIISYHKQYCHYTNCLKVRETNTQSSRYQHFIVYSPLCKTFQFIKVIHERAALDRYYKKRRVEININIQEILQPTHPKQLNFVVFCKHFLQTLYHQEI